MANQPDSVKHALRRLFEMAAHKISKKPAAFLIILFLAGCTQLTTEAVLDPQLQEQNRKWLTDFTESNVKGFRPVASVNGIQCNTKSLPGSWRRQFSGKTTETLSATWSFSGTGEISCTGSDCREKTGTPKRYAVRKIFDKTPKQNVGILVIFDNNSILRSTCEIDGNKLYLGTPDTNGIIFRRAS